MSQPIVIPPVETPEERFARAMQNPAVRMRAANDPLFAARLREALTPGPMFSQGPDVDPRASRTFARPPVSTTFSGFGVAPTGMSVADQVRMQRDAFLVTDGVQVTGNYDTAIRAQKGGIPAPRTPRVGSPSAFYPYPGDNMRTGAALAGNGVVASETRGLLPTAGYNPGAFVATRPDSLNRSLPVNVPVPMPRRRLPVSTTGIITSSPSEDRRRGLSTLMGLGATPKDPNIITDASGTRQVTNYDLLVSFFQNDAVYRAKHKKIANGFLGFLDLLKDRQYEALDLADKERVGPAQLSNIKYVWFQTVEAAKIIARALIESTILAKTIDFNSGDLRLALEVFGIKNANEALNKGLTSVYGPKFNTILTALGGKFPLNLENTGIREGLLRYLYRQIWSADMSAEIFNAVSSKLACQDAVLGASMATAITEMRKAEYAPGKTPKAAICPAAQQYIVPVEGGTDIETTGADTGPSMTLVKGGLIAAAVLVGLGVYAKTR